MKKNYSIQLWLMAAFIVLILLTTAHPYFNSGVASDRLGIAHEVHNVVGSVVHIQSIDKGYQGSGVIVSDTGLIMTAHHVVDGCKAFVVTLNNGKEFTCSRAIIDTENDIAFLRIDRGDECLSVAEFGNVSNRRVGDGIFLVGSPYGKDHFNSVTFGIISSLSRSVDHPSVQVFGWQHLMQVDAASNPGNSGGPLFDLNCKLVGILVGGPSGAEGISYCVRLDRMETLIEEVERMFIMDRFRLQGVEDGPNPKETWETDEEKSEGGTYSPW